MLLLKSLFVLLHIVAAAAWFGLGLRLNAQARLVVRLGGEPGHTAAEDLLRTVRQLRLFLVLTLLFALGAFFAGGGFRVYGPVYHTSLLLLVVLLLLHTFLVQPAARGLLGAVAREDGEAFTRHQKKLSMGTGLGHLLWLVVLILMLWPGYFQIAL
ncbi:hypothetical protein GQ464_016620 [Rhodocaloribacter litoris]|uniref:hypothetical protein n=1 Tax=Rhodocaloribacter litoris TaxID=2558931 RepID=UPI00142431E6|nr:hypothetical protein [Rhodocaloribacter litoris]QXD15011.1 hypothetical protein GQ464_016620 [Rhodocaloribacter litoris]GIV62197.1 MAG: hypothetical protein KatS3mg044_1063 [Rhodothermaceae bacterium]